MSTIGTCAPAPRPTRAAALLVSLLVASAASAQPVPLRAKLESDVPVHFAGEPIRVRFSLTNPTDAPFELKAKGGAPAAEGAAVLLSDHHVFNTENDQGVWVSPAGAAGRLELSLSAISRDAPATHLTLGPRTSVGREVDLLRAFPRLKTAGVYEVVWRPCGGAIGSNTLRIRVVPRREVVLKTDAGEIVLELLYDKAPETCLAFVRLVESGFYDGLAFHRVSDGAFVQGGGVDAAGNSKHAAELAAEFNAVEHRAGIVSMARRVDPDESAAQPPRKAFADSARSQFFICLNRMREWDGRFTAFARVRQGLDVASKISRVPADAESGKPNEPVVIRKATARDALRP